MEDESSLFDGVYSADIDATPLPVTHAHREKLSTELSAVPRYSRKHCGLP